MNRNPCAALAVLLVAGCAAPGPMLVPVDDSTMPVAVAGFIVMAPSGPGWHRFSAGPGATFMRPTESRWHTVVVQALPVAAPAAALDGQGFEEFVRKRVEGRLEPKRHRVLRNAFERLEAGSLDCIAYELDVEDTGVQPDGTPFVFDLRGRVCRIPAAAGPWLDASFSERGGPRGFSPELKE